MKKLTVVFVILVTIVLTACTKDQVNENEQIEILSPSKTKQKITGTND